MSGSGRNGNWRLRRQFEQQGLDLLHRALKKVNKAELVELTLRLARQQKGNWWLIEQAVDLDKPVDLLVHEIKIAIDKATYVERAEC